MQSMMQKVRFALHKYTTSESDPLSVADYDTTCTPLLLHTPGLHEEMVRWTVNSIGIFWSALLIPFHTVFGP